MSNTANKISSRPGAGVLRKAVAALDALAELDGLTPSELAQRIHEPRSSIYRLLNALEDLGLVEQDARGSSYQLGVHLLRLGTAVARRFEDEHTTARPAIEWLHEQTGQTVFLTIRHDFNVVCLERLDGELVRVMTLPAGGSLPLHGAAAGRTLLAFESREFWNEYLDHGPLKRFTEKTVVSRARVLEQLEQIRRDGYAIGDEDVIPFIGSVGAPVFGHQRQIRASISLSGPRPATLGDNRERTVALVTAAAKEASRALGLDESEAQPSD